MKMTNLINLIKKKQNKKNIKVGWIEKYLVLMFFFLLNATQLVSVKDSFLTLKLSKIQFNYKIVVSKF